MKALVYDTETGEIRRQMQGRVPLENQRFEGNEAAIVFEFGQGDLPEDKPVYHAAEPFDMGNMTGKKVDHENKSIIDDPDYNEPRTREDIKTDLEGGEITTKDALLEILDIA